MQCGGCANKLSLALRTLNGVDDVQISLASGEVTIVYDPPSSPGPDARDRHPNRIRAGGVDATNGHDRGLINVDRIAPPEGPAGVVR